ncbi:hypothetical protein MXD63_45175, partial [Frankia sp. Cpl3]|nr:hypothetical protein [Frankia sp. Cpl3]
MVLIRWKKTRKRPNHPLLINQWTGALEVVEKEEQSKGATEERHGETEQSHSGMVPINGNQEDVENTAAASASEAELKII